MIKSINNLLSWYDGIITYYGSKFDCNFLRTRALALGIEPLAKIKHLDLYYTAKRVICSKTRRMDRVNEILQLGNPDGSPDKTRLAIQHWSDVVIGRNSESLRYIIEHCIKDVEILENATKQLRQFAPDRILRR